MARTVRCTKISRGDSAKPDARIAEANWIDMIESPPSAKNDSVTDTRSTQQPGDHRGQQLFDRPERRDIRRGRTEVGCGQRFPVDLAGTVQRNLGELIPYGRHHECRKLFRRNGLDGFHIE